MAESSIKGPAIEVVEAGALIVLAAAALVGVFYALSAFIGLF